MALAKFETVLKGHGFQPCRKYGKINAALQLAEKHAFAPAFGWRSSSPLLHLLLGGAAVHRCDKSPVFQ
jgi:hypothetical protein